MALLSQLYGGGFSQQPSWGSPMTTAPGRTPIPSGTQGYGGASAQVPGSFNPVSYTPPQNTFSGGRTANPGISGGVSHYGGGQPTLGGGRMPMPPQISGGFSPQPAQQGYLSQILDNLYRGGQISRPMPPQNLPPQAKPADGAVGVAAPPPEPKRYSPLRMQAVSMPRFGNG